MQTNCILSAPVVCRLSDEATKNNFLSLKNTKSVADCGKFWSSSLARFMPAAQFASVSSCTKRLLKHSRRKSLQIIPNTDDCVVPSPMISHGQSCGSAACPLDSRLKSLTVSTFSSVQALPSLPLPGRLSNVPVSHNFFNRLLTPRFVQLFSGKLSVNLFVVYSFKYKLFTKILSSSLNTMLIVDKHCSDICCDEFPVPQTDCKSS